MRSGVSRSGVLCPQIEASTPGELEQAFGDLGVQVGPRVGPSPRSHDQKEWWSLRRYLFSLSAAERLGFPIEIVKGERPDFRCIFGGARLGIEVAEATHPRDQRENGPARADRWKWLWLGPAVDLRMAPLTQSAHGRQMC